MAGNTVTLTFAGDTRDLDRAFSQAGDSSDRMASRVGDASNRAADGLGGASSKAQDAIDKFGGLEDQTDASEKKFQGFADTITGTGDIIQGFKDGDIVGMATGFADLAGGLTDFLIPTLASLGSTLVGTVIPAVWSFTTALLTSPITWIVLGIAAVIAAIVLMATHWGQVKKVVGIVVDWIVDKWRGFTSWISGIARSIGGFFSGMWDGLKAGAKAALNWVIDRLNTAVDALNFLIRGFNMIPGVNLPQIPHIPRMHTGGIVPGAPGSEMLAVLQAGERVIPADKSRTVGGGGGEIRIVGNADSAVGTMISNLIRIGVLQLPGA